MNLGIAVVLLVLLGCVLGLIHDRCNGSSRGAHACYWLTGVGGDVASVLCLVATVLIVVRGVRAT